MRFADIILPLAVPGTFTYALPDGLDDVPVGARVVVPFGRGRKLYSGLVIRTHRQPPAKGMVRDVLSVMDATPVVNERQLLLWERMTAHYLCTPGETMIAGLPGPLVLSSSSRIMPGPAVLDDLQALGRESIVVEALERQPILTLEQAAELLGVKDPMPVVKRLIERGAVMLAEGMREDLEPRMERTVRLAPGLGTDAALHALFDRLEKAPKQLHLLMKYVEISRCLGDDPRDVPRDALLRAAGTTSGMLKQMVDKGIFEIHERPPGAVPPAGAARPPVSLSEAQTKALDAVRAGLSSHPVVLLHGITSSGKTELYVKLIGEAIDRGDQVLYLLPEIALTTQVIGRLKARFGERIAVFHSRLGQRDRIDLWHRMLKEDQAPPIVVGARSAIFVPFHRLRLVIVDEEHDPSYKQQDPAPRYQARDMAVLLAGIHDARVVLGSATPSMESRHNARTGKYAYAELLVRHGEAPLPEIVRVDLRDAYRRRQMKGHLSQPLVDAIGKAIARREQTILFQNRRGYVPVWQCETCGWVPGCDHCDASLTYHKQQHGLRCHYCGREYTPPSECPSCGSKRLRMLGFGTEKIEEELQLIFPDARVARMDQDTTRGRQAFERILGRFGEGAIDILVGTQMVTKGLDFDQVSLVGILNADRLLRYPDFRAHERAFQLMAQVAGRSGRRNNPGVVFLQAHDVHHPVIGLVMAHDTEGFHLRELEHRRAHGYPPFTRLVQLTMKHRTEDRLVHTATGLAARLAPVFAERMLGPEAPPVARVRDKHLRTLLFKLRKDRYGAEKQAIRDAIDRHFAMPEHSPVQLVVDVDPM